MRLMKQLDDPRLNEGRRSLITMGGKVALAATLAGPALVRAAEGTVKVGMVIPKIGPWAEAGSGIYDGVRFAMSQVKDSVLNRPLELVWLDDPNPQGGQQNMLRVIQQEKVVAVLGGFNSASALGASAVAQSEKIPLIVVGAAAREITGSRCHRYVFRQNVTVPGFCQLIGPRAAAAGKRWYFLYGDFAFGQDVYKTMQAQMNALGCSEVGADSVSPGTTDFSSIILKIRQARPDVVVLGTSGADNVAFAKQFTEFGMKDKVAVVGPTLSENEIVAMGLEAATGTYGLMWHHKDPQNPPEDAALVAAIKDQRKRPPLQNDYLGWLAMRMMIAGISKGGGTDSESIVRGLETLKLPNGVYYRAWDHQLMHRAVAVKVKNKPTVVTDMLDIVDHAPRSFSDIENFHGTRGEIGCRMA